MRTFHVASSNVPMHSIRNILALSAVLPAALAQFTTKINRAQTAHTISGSWIARVESNELLDTVLSTVLESAGVESKANYTIGGVKGFSFDGDETGQAKPE